MRISRFTRKSFIGITAALVLTIGLVGAVHGKTNTAVHGQENYENLTLNSTLVQIATPVPVATNESLYASQTLHLEELAHASYDLPQEVYPKELYFISANLTVILSPYQDNVPPSVMSMEDAAQIGARYIWDVFGESIDGMYVVMFHTNWVGHIRQHWGGNVFLTEATEPFDPSFFFLIDSSTGERIDISYFTTANTRGNSDFSYGDSEVAGAWATSEEEFETWFSSEEWLQIHSMDDDGLKQYLGLTNEMFEEYTQAVVEYAQGHFNQSAIAVVNLGTSAVTSSGEIITTSGIGILPFICDNGNMYPRVATLTFDVIDENERIAQVTISSRHWYTRFVHIITQQNDRTLGFVYE